MTKQANYNIVVFAHNEAKRIRRCLVGLLDDAPDGLVQIYVLINGSTDNTLQIVSELSITHPQITPVKLDIADKASSWNHYIQQLSEGVDAHIFMDGDCYVADNALPALLAKFDTSHDVLAATASPATGRSIVQWRNNIQRWGRICGALYALTEPLVAELRAEKFQLPTGLIGEDFIVTCLAKGSIEQKQLFNPSSRLAVASDAGFKFDSLKWWLIEDWKIAFNRLITYQVREYQLKLLFYFMQDRQPDEMPADIRQLYLKYDVMIKYQYRGRNTFVDMLAVRRIKNILKEFKRLQS